ncbi:ABC transporter G family member 15 [Glycine soja]
MYRMQVQYTYIAPTRSRENWPKQKPYMVMIWEDVTVERPASFGAHDNKKLLNRITGFAEPARIMAVMGPSGCGKTTFLDSITDITVQHRFLEDKKKLLSGITGFAEAGRIMAVMGPSGSGKTTLLDSLAGRLPVNVVVTGNILINGKRSLYSKEVSYVAQEELFLGTLTVKETLTYSANTRLPSKMSKEEINKVVEETIMEMGLEDCADTRIGNWHCRGISNGEKKRLSIGLEILTQPHVLLLDEPTTGLDSASAFYVIQSLCHIALNGKIVICSIHQPSSETFDLFDDLLLLSIGETVYFGEANMALKGYPALLEEILQIISFCPSSSNSALGTKKAEIRETLIRSYKGSGIMINARRRIQQLKPNEEQKIKPNIGSSATWWKQLCTLTKRSFVNMTRDIGYYWLRMVFYILVGITVGTLYFHIGTANNSILDRGKCVSFIYGFNICLSGGGLPFFIEELKVFYGERSKGHYGEAAFVVSNIISSFPFLVLTSLSSGIIIYFMVQLHPGLTNFAFFCIDLFCCISVVECCMMIVASVVPNVLMGLGTGTGVIVFMMMPSLLFRPLQDIPKFFWRYPMSYLSFTTWAVQGQYKNDMLGLEFDPLLPGNPKLTGEQFTDCFFSWCFGIAKDHRHHPCCGFIDAGESLQFAERCLFSGEANGFEEAREPDAVATMEEVETHHKGTTGGADGEYETSLWIRYSDFRFNFTTWDALVHLSIDQHMTKNEIDKVVTKILAEMGLQDSTDSRLGNWHLRGISSGEKRRLSIGIEIITQPHVMFLDEPTSGLDSAAAFYNSYMLHSPAKGEVFNLFDDLVLLSGGEAVYFGEATMTVKFFADAGFPCPTRKSPPEHFLGCVSSEFNGVAALIQSKNEASSSWNSLMNMTREVIKSELIKYYRNSIHSENARKKNQRNQTKAGFLCFNIGTSTEAILTGGKCDGFIVGLMIFICLGGVPFYHEELKGQFKNDLIGLEFEPEVPGDTKIKGEEILNNMFGIRNVQSESFIIITHQKNYPKHFTQKTLIEEQIYLFEATSISASLIHYGFG